MSDDGFDASQFAAKMSSIGHAGSMGGGGGHGNEEHILHIGIDETHLQQLLDQFMAGHPGSTLMVRGLLEAGALPVLNILDQAGFLFKILPPTTIPLLPRPGEALMSRSH